MVEVAATLSQEDLARWRKVCADKELLEASIPGISVNEGRDIVLSYYKIMDDIFTTYNLDITHIECYFISPFTGHILLNDA